MTLSFEEFHAGIKRRAKKNRVNRLSLKERRRNAKLSIEKLAEIPEPTEEQLEDES